MANGWEYYLEHPEWGAALGIGDIISDTPVNLRVGPGLEYAVWCILERGVLVYVFDPLPATEPPGEWLPVLVLNDLTKYGYVHSACVVKMFPCEDYRAAAKVMATLALNKLPAKT